MTKQELIKMLLDATASLANAEEEVAQLEILRRGHEFTLKDKEMRLLLDETGPINGKNAELRTAQLFSLSEPEHVLVMDAEAQVTNKKAELNTRRSMHRSLLAISYLIAGSADGGVDFG